PWSPPFPEGTFMVWAGGWRNKNTFERKLNAARSVAAEGGGGNGLLLPGGAGPEQAQDAAVAAVVVLDLDVVGAARVEDELPPALGHDQTGGPVVDHQLAVDPQADGVVVPDPERVALGGGRMDGSGPPRG